MKYIIAAELVEKLVECILKATHHEKTAQQIHDLVSEIKNLEPLHEI